MMVFANPYVFPDIDMASLSIRRKYFFLSCFKNIPIFMSSSSTKLNGFIYA